MSYRGKLSSAVALFLLLLSGAFALWACGPFFPPWLLTDEAGVLEAPTTWLRDALQPLLPAGKPAFPAVVAEKGPVQQTAAADRKDLETALAGLPPERRQAVAGPYLKVREAFVSYRDAVAAWREEAAFAQSPPPRPAPPASLAVPSGLPGEFEDYLRGAIAYYQEKPEAARAAWEKLLARPAGERRLRSTWAAFMLGKIALATDPAAAIRGFERTRELAGQGFPDPLGLAEASVGWQARAEAGRHRLDEALKLYLQQQKAGDPTALPSIRRTCAKALKDPEGLRRVARAPEARAIFTAWVLSVWSRQDYDGPLDPAAARKWLNAVQAAGVTQADGADRLAWAAYRAGDFAAADAWLKRAPADAPMARWIRAKLLLRAGKVAEAEPLLAEARAALPAAPDPEHDLWEAYDSEVRPALRPRAAGELGAARLAKGEYTAALDDLLRGGWWTDAAYVAERVLTVDELRAYVDKTWSADLAARYKPDPRHNVDEPGAWETIFAGVAPPPDGRVSYELRDLLGRRLAREGKLAEARAYLADKRRPALDDLARSLAQGRDAARPAAERSQALFRAACLARYQGLDLLGTEIEPDWALFEGSYAVDSFAEKRADPKLHRVLGPSPDERQRVRRNRVEPEKRFHYRYQGMDLALEAAKLLPAGSEERARLLATAGNWVEGMDPKGARPLYDAIQSCCADTETARRSRKVSAITNVPDACPADTRPKEGEERPTPALSPRATLQPKSRVNAALREIGLLSRLQRLRSDVARHSVPGRSERRHRSIVRCGGQTIGGLEKAIDAALPDRLPEQGRQRLRTQEAAGLRLTGDTVRQGQPDVVLNGAFSLSHESSPGISISRAARIGASGYHPPVPPSPILPLLRFHFAVGARLAMRLLVPVVAIGFGAGMLLGTDFVTSFARVLFGSRASGGTAVLFAALLLGSAMEAAPRVCRGLGGWLRHLPVSGLAHRRAAGLAIAVAQLPLLLGLLFISLFASLSPAALLANAAQADRHRPGRGPVRHAGRAAVGGPAPRPRRRRPGGVRRLGMAGDRRGPADRGRSGGGSPREARSLRRSVSTAARGGR